MKLFTTLYTPFINCPYSKIVLVTCSYAGIFAAVPVYHIFIANYQPASDVLIHLVSSRVLRFQQDNSGMAPLVALCSLHVPKVVRLY